MDFKNRLHLSIAFLCLVGTSTYASQQCQIISPLPVPVSIAGCTFTGILPSGSTSYIQNTLSPTTTSQQFSVQDSSVSKSETLGFIGGTQCLHSVNGSVSGTGSDCGSGGGSNSSFSLSLTTGGPNAFSGVAISSSNSTTEILFDSATTQGLASGGTYFFSLNPSSVTLQGNTFNGNNKLLQLSGSGVVGASQFPALTGDITTSAGALATTAAAAQTHITSIPSGLTLGSNGNSVTISSNLVTNGTTIYANGNITTNLTPSRCVQTDANGNLTAAGAACGSGNGGSYSLAMTTGGPNSFSGAAISTSPSVVLFDSATTNGKLISGGTYFFTLNASSVTEQGPLPTLLGTVTQGTWNGTRLTSTYIPTDTVFNDNAPSATFTSSVTVIAGGGLGITYGIQGSTLSLVNSASTFTFLISTSATSVPQLSVSSAVAIAPTDFLLTVSSAQGGSTAGTMAVGIQNDGHIISSGTTPSMGTCGTNPSVNGTDNAGIITVGGGVVTSCTMNFAYSWSNPPVCVESDNSTSVTADISSISTTAITFGFSATLGGGSVWYICMGQKG